MVSNAVKMSQAEVIEGLKRLKREGARDTEYKKLRKDLPPDWPI